MSRIASFMVASALSLGIAHDVQAHDFAALDQAASATVLALAPVFDFDGDGCLPAAGISRNGDQNGGLKPTGSLGGGCRYGSFLNVANTMHRQACVWSGGAEYCGHFFALYFLKDQAVPGFELGGHRHDWEYAAVWTVNGVVTHGSYSAHGSLDTRPASTLPFENGHLKIVYHKDGVRTHSLRFAGASEGAENPYGRFVTPNVASWFEMRGDVDNEALRTLLNRYDYGSANLPVRDGSFVWNLNTFRPAGFPEFPWESARNPRGDLPYYQIVNQASGLCMDVAGANMSSGADVIQWNCSGADWQAFSYDSASGAMRVKHDPRYCLDNSSRWENGADLVLWWCNGGDAQRFTVDGGAIRMRTYTSQVVDGYGTSAGDDVGTWSDWGGANQRWRFDPR